MLKNVEKDEVLEEIVKELSRKYNKKEEIIKKMIIKGHDLEFEEKELKDLIEEFFCI